MEFLKNIFITAIAVFILAYLLPGITVTSFLYALVVALVLGLLQAIVKPILVLLTLPATILTMGLFLFVINACIVLLADYFLANFSVDGFWFALLFSILLSVLQSLLFSIVNKN